MTIPGGYIAGDVLSAADMNLLPAGRVGYAQVVANQGGITALADLTSLTVTWTALAARRYRLSFEGQALNSVGSTLCDFVIATSANVQVANRSIFMASAGVSSSLVSASVCLTGLSGSVTYKMRASSPSGTLQFTASATNPAFFLVEDIGPA